jgi:hypothetical protein
MENQERGFLRIWMFAVLLIGVGIIAIWKLPPYFLLDKIAEALIVAGVLALFVDPLLKRALLVEASRGIFVHLLGFEHRPEVKDKLKELVFETKLLRKTLDLHCLVEERVDGYFDFTVEYDTEIINPTNNAIDYVPRMDFDKAHKVEVLQMTFTSSDNKYRWHGRPEPKEREREPGVDVILGKTFTIQPESKGVAYKVHGHYKILLRNGYSQFYCGRPTLRTTMRAKAPAGYELTTTPATVENSNYWQYDSIQMLGDHITLRWRKTGGEW